MASALPTSAISWPGPQGQLQGAWSAAGSVRGGVLVIHENKGLNDWVRSVAGRFAGAGYSALAIDLLSEEGGSGKFTDPAQATAALGQVPPDRFTADLKSGVAELQRRVPDRKVSVVGFCFGGGLVWQLLASGEPRLSAAVPFYGPLPDNPDFGGSKAAVLAIYAALDTRVTAPNRRPRRPSTAPGSSTRSSSSPTPTMRFSTTPDRATTPPPPLTPGNGCSIG